MTQAFDLSGNAPAAPIVVDLTQDQIKTAATALQKIRPAYGPIIEFYSRVFRAQADAMAGARIDPFVIDDALLALKRDNEMPLITPVQFKIDIENAGELMEKICKLATAYAPKLSQAGETLGQALKADEIDLEQFFTALLDGMDILSLAKKLKIKPESLAFFGFSAMAPSIRTCAAQLTHYLDDGIQRSRSARAYCPICGSTPDLALFDDAGNKQVSCSLCSHIWQVPRMGCLFCDTQKKEDQQYFFTGEETEYRVYCCKSCQRYVKTVDTREMGRRFFPKLEQIATLHLDMKAREEGYTPAGQDGNTI